MENFSVGGIIKTSVVTAFTIAAALIWKDVIIEIIEMLFPESEAILYKLLAAIIATIFVIVGIYLILKTEAEAEYVVQKLKVKRSSSKQDENK